MANTENKYLDENIALPIGVWLCEKDFVYMLEESPYREDYHKGVKLRRNKWFIHPNSSGSQEEREAFAQKLHSLLEADRLSGHTPDPERGEK